MSCCLAGSSREKARRGRFVWRVVAVLLFAQGVAVCAWGAAGDSGGRNSSRECPSSAKGEERGRFILVGFTNLYPRLQESEERIDRQINGPLGLLLPRWENPETFRDWREEWLLFNLLLGYGQDISARWSWFVAATGGAGAVRNHKRYHPLGFPLWVDVDFERSSYALEAGVEYFPWGRPPTPKARGMVNKLRCIRPVAGLALGYNRETDNGTVSLDLPFVGKVLTIEDRNTYDLFYVTPNIGVECPLGRRTSLVTVAGYSFFNAHETDYSGPLVNVMVRYRF